MLLYLAIRFFSPEDSSARDLANQLSVHCRSVHLIKKTGSRFLSKTQEWIQYVLGTKNRNCLKKGADTIVS